jgi:hypothetical protein
MTHSNSRLVARILVISSGIFLLLSALSWSGTLPIDPAARRLFALAFGICATADAVIGLILWTRSREN